jgi:hypothetical protein
MTDPYASPPPSFEPRPTSSTTPASTPAGTPLTGTTSGSSALPTSAAAGPGRLDGAKGAFASMRWRVGRISRGDPLQSVIVVWLLFLAVAAVYALIRPVIRSLFYDIGILISLTDLIDLLVVFFASVGAIAAIVCVIVIAVRTVREEMPASTPPPALPGTRSTGGTTRGRP